MKHRILALSIVALLLIGLVPLGIGTGISGSLPDSTLKETDYTDLSGEPCRGGSPLEDMLPLEQVSDSAPPTEMSKAKGKEWNLNYTDDWRDFAYAEGNKTRLIVGLDGEASSSLYRLEKLVTECQAEIVNEVSIKGEVVAVVVEISFDSVTEVIEEIRNANLASYVEPNMKFQAQMVPNDPYWYIQWGPQKIGAEWAWNITVGDSSVLVAVVDTGIDYTHPDIAANYVALGYDWANDDPDPIDDFGHGTHCAGIIAAVLNNGLGIAGVANVSIMAEKVLDVWGGGYADWVANGIINAADSGADVISMSIGSYGWGELLRTAVNYAYESGVLMVAAAGNEETSMKLYPAGYDEVVAVSATDRYDNTAWFSNWGDWIELAAPGVDIYSTMPTYYVTMNDFGYSQNYDYMGGTSMACPHVAGVAALVLSRYPNRTRDWVRRWLQLKTDDLGAEGLDIYFGYGRVNARRAVEETPPAHELIAYGLETPIYVEPGGTGRINVTVLNFGENDETNVNVQLLANDVLVDISSISFVASGSSTATSLTWNPGVEGLYNITVYVVPVPDEEDTENNAISKYIYVGSPVKAVVLNSAGNYYSEIITNWQVLNTEWPLFGDTMVYVDYTTLNKEDISYEDITATEADVLIISCAYDWDWQFTDSEIEAIARYAHEGHGLIATAGTLYQGVPNNNKLAPLFGLDEKVMWEVTGTDLMHLVNTTHPIFTGVPNPLIFPAVQTALPYDGRWDSNELTGGEYLAIGHYEESAIVTFRGLVYFSPWLEIIPPHYHHHLQLLYNIITWSTYQRPQHELAVFLETEERLEPGEQSWINATVSNLGQNNETNVELQLFINEDQVDNVTIPELPVDSSFTLSFQWTPQTQEVYNITAYAPPVLGEQSIEDNIAQRRIVVMTITFTEVLVYSDDYLTSPSSRYVIVALDNLGINYTHYSDDPSGFASALASQRWDLVVVDHCNYYLLGDYWTELEEYVLNGGLLIISTFDVDGSNSEPTTLWNTLGVQWASDMQYPQPVYRWEPSHPIFTFPNTVGDLSSYTEDYFDDGDHVTATTGTPVAGFWPSLTEGSSAIVVGNAYPTVLFSFILDEFRYDEDSDGTLDAIELWENAIAYVARAYEHDLAVALDAPGLIELGQSTVLSATVWNTGLNNETDVELHLLIGGEMVNSTTIDELPKGSSATVSFLWVPMNTGEHNVTAYAPPLPEEEYLTNNLVTKKIGVFYYTRVYLTPRWVGGGTPMMWHGDDISWACTLPFDFPFYGIHYETIYVSSNGLITFTSPDTSYSNSILGLAERLAIAPAWDDWVTYSPHDIYIWENSTHVGIRWYVAAYYDNSITANFEVILGEEGIIQFNYASNDGPISATIGISNGIGHIIAETVWSTDYINTIVFSPFQRDVAIYNVTASPSQVQVGETVNINVTVANEGEMSEDIEVRVYYENATEYSGSASLVLSIPTEPHSANAMWIEPAFKDLTDYNVGDRFNVTAWLNLTEISFVWQIQLLFEPTYLYATRAGYTAGSTSDFFAGHTTVSVQPIIDNATGYIMYGETLLVDSREPGYGSLCWIEFGVASKPSEPYQRHLHLDPSRTYVLDPNLWDLTITLYDGAYGFFVSPPPPPPPSPLIGKEIVYLPSKSNETLAFAWNTTGVRLGNYTIKAVAVPVEGEIDLEDNTFVDGTVEILSVHDVALTRVSPATTWVYQGQTAAFNVTVENRGDVNENVTVTLYYNITGSSLIGTGKIAVLLPDENRTITLLWDTTEVTPCRNYTITAVATIETIDRNPADNILEDGCMKIRFVGDVNGDDKVDMRDVGVEARAFGSFPGHPRWNPDYDLNGDERINMRDVAIVVKNFGSSPCVN